MKKVKLVTFCIMFVSSLSAQTIRDHRSFAWKLMRGSDGKDINVDNYGRFSLVNTVGKFYEYEGPDWKEQYWFLPPPKRSIQMSAENMGVKAKSVDNVIWSFPKRIRHSDGNYYWRLEWDTIQRATLTRDLAVNSDSTIWKIHGDGRIYYLNQYAYTYVKWFWRENPGIDGSRIAAGGGQVWAINTAGKIYRHRNPKNASAGWEQMPGSDGRDIAVANDGAVWLVNTVGKIYRWYGTGWTQQPGSDGYRIAANKGKVVLINTAGKMYYGEY